MSLSCDHDATRRNFEAFIAGTKLIGGMPDGNGGWMLLGVCTHCDSTLAIPIADPRGTAVKGEILAGAQPHSQVSDDEPPVRVTLEDSETLRKQWGE